MLYNFNKFNYPIYICIKLILLLDKFNDYNYYNYPIYLGIIFILL